MSLRADKPSRVYFNEDDFFIGRPSGGRVTQWIVGIGGALCFVIWGMSGLLSGHAILYGRNGRLELYGTDALAVSCAYLALGAFIHFHWFWGLHPVLRRFSQGLKIVSLLTFVSGFVWTLYRIFWSGL